MPPFNVSQGSLHPDIETSGPPLEEMWYRAQDDASRLRKEVCTLRIRAEELEEERNFHAAKANELISLVKITKGDVVKAELVKRTLEVAELKNQVQKLKEEKEEMSEENRSLQRRNDSAHKDLQDLSLVVRSLQTSAYAEEEDYESDAEDEEEEIELTAEKALDLTLSNMKAHIEVLEEALQAKASQCKDFEKKVIHLEKDNDVNCTKISILEELLREVNQNRSDEQVRKEQEANVGMESLSQERGLRRHKSLSVPALKIGERMRRSLTRESPGPAESTKEIVQTNAQAVANMRNIKICFRKAGLEGTYTGPVQDGLPHGVGTVRFTNGDTYLGEMTNGKMSGKGTLYTKNRGVFRGRFQNNKFVE